jgi:hypothetical protein
VYALLSQTKCAHKFIDRAQCMSVIDEMLRNGMGKRRNSLVDPSLHNPFIFKCVHRALRCCYVSKGAVMVDQFNSPDAPGIS